jgi:hypothetical protein
VLEAASPSQRAKLGLLMGLESAARLTRVGALHILPTTARPSHPTEKGIQLADFRRDDAPRQPEFVDFRGGGGPGGSLEAAEVTN